MLGETKFIHATIFYLRKTEAMQFHFIRMYSGGNGLHYFFSSNVLHHYV